MTKKKKKHVDPNHEHVIARQIAADAARQLRDALDALRQSLESDNVALGDILQTEQIEVTNVEVRMLVFDKAMDYLKAVWGA